MTGWVLAAGAGLGVATWRVQAPPPQQRLVSRGAAERAMASRSATAVERPRLRARRSRRLVACSAGLAVFVVSPGLPALVLGGLVALGLDRWFAALPDRTAVAAAAAARRQLPQVLDLMAAALTAGTPTDAAVALAARGCGPPLDGPLHAVGASLRLGAGAEEAWRLARDDPVLRQLARLAVRSAASGAAMADACRELAAHAREAQVLEAEAAIKRAGVLSVLPVALCFLPAFVLVGVVPIVVGLLASLSL
ncbi:hypothetical protein acdb102_11610 [Acidothermaceae bacterium B102]|nr:hypothetical protein acdb102_11610 [Acidothermaceae bacterium B102]